MEMKIEVIKPGMFTTVQDLGRRGYQMHGVPVSGAMDLQALKLGNILVGNDEGLAGLEITIIGPVLKILSGQGCFAVTGAEVGILKNGVPFPCWKAHKISAGDTLSFTLPSLGSRSMLCVSGGFDVPLVMGSRSAYTRGGFGGYEGRTLKAGDVLSVGVPDLLWALCEELECPAPLRPVRDPDAPLRVLAGPQEDLFSEDGLAAFYSSEYVISNSADRMGYRMEGAVIAHKRGADIISDAVCMGSVQVPGDGQPIVMLADRQTTGGYAKIGTVCSVDVSNLAQRIPGQRVRFKKITLQEALELLKKEAKEVDGLRQLRASWRSRPDADIKEPVNQTGDNFYKDSLLNKDLKVYVDGEAHFVSWEKIN